MMCHELGHFIGGLPYVRVQESVGIFKIRNNFKNMSAEGQADYFATSICFPRIVSFLNLPQKRDVSINYCKSSDINCIKSIEAIQQNIALYQRILLESQSKAFVNVDIFEKVDSEATETKDKPGEYPSLQCRAQTMVNGYLDSGLNQNKQGRPMCWYRNSSN